MSSSLPSTITESHLSVATDASNHTSHIHLPGPSFWPFLLSVALLVSIGGLLFIDTAPWISIVGAPFVLVGIMGWALEDPFASHSSTKRKPVVMSGSSLILQNAI